MLRVSAPKQKVAIFGLDCADPLLVFQRWRDQLPFLSQAMARGAFGRLQSTLPPITIPAWSCMMTSKDPGQLGCYGFRNRKSHEYEDLVFATSLSIKSPTLWDLLSAAGYSVIVAGVPQTYPPKPVNGCLISCFLTPDNKGTFTYPSSLKQEIQLHAGEYIFDVRDFRTDNKAHLLSQIYAMAEQRFSLLHYLIERKPWDFFMMVDMGVDRIHHGFWRFMDSNHRLYQPGNPYEHVIFDYYRYLDKQLSLLTAAMGEDTAILVVSDHGAKAMAGGVCINEWLLQQGYLRLKAEPPAPAPLKAAMIDWTQTIAWGEGGYHGRIFFNVMGREPQGIIPQHELAHWKQKIAAEISLLQGPNGEMASPRVHDPEVMYRAVAGVPPDLIVYFGDLSWRSVGSVGLRTLYTFSNDTGPDDANHAEHGIFIAQGTALTGDLGIVSIYDVAPTVLDLFGISKPGDMIGASILPTASPDGEEVPNV